MTPLQQFLDDPDQLRIWIPAEDDARWDDPEDHGDPKIERWARTLAAFGSHVATAATLACADLIIPAWEGDRSEPIIANAIEVARTGHPDPTRALAALDAMEGKTGAAHLHDVLRAARCALLALDPKRAAAELELAALFAFRVIGWSKHRHTAGERLLDDRLTGVVVAATDGANRTRQLVRLSVRAALLRVDTARGS